MMKLYKIGSTGKEVVKIQKKLKKLGYYHGPIDGIFGGGTYSAVKNFQRDHNLKVDGIVGEKTWEALFQKNIPNQSIKKKPLIYRCMALTGTFETGKDFPECFAGISGDFDGQGMSLGVLQWNFGQGSLQPLLKEMLSKHRNLMEKIFNEYLTVLETVLKLDRESQLEFLRSIQHPVKHFIYEPWRGMFKSLCRTEEFQKIQIKHAQDLFEKALDLVKDFNLWSERAVALMFDIKVQNGGIRDITKKQITVEIEKIPETNRNDLEVKKMVIIANKRAEASNPRWIEDVRSRKLCIAYGKGYVHGIEIDLENQYGIRLKEMKI
ncbi:MAG TPA: peptidoglycan-binding protein [Persephonella sp.]|nr:peptidoglycan-binding protein [Persephonella sp.]